MNHCHVSETEREMPHLSVSSGAGLARWLGLFGTDDDDDESLDRNGQGGGGPSTRRPRSGWNVELLRTDIEFISYEKNLSCITEYKTVDHTPS